MFYPIRFADIPVGTEFWWGGYTLGDMNWGRKRSSRTADYTPNLSGKMLEWGDWAYWKQDETVYVLM